MGDYKIKSWRPANPHKPNFIDAVPDEYPATRFFDNMSFIGDRGTACFLIETSAGLVLIDCLWPNDRCIDIIERGIRDLGFDPDKLKAIVLTHGHFDHMGAANALSQALGIPIFAHENAAEYLLNPFMNLSIHCGPEITVQNFQNLKGGDEVILASNTNFRLKTIYVPGHTTDSIAFYSEKENVAFVGDTLFKGSLGSAQFPGGNLMQLIQSITDRLFCLPDNTILLSGHSEQTTVGEAKKDLSSIFRNRMDM